MLPTSFAPLASAEPRFRSVYTKLDRWIRKHRDWQWLVPGIVSRDFPELDPFALTSALKSAVRHGVLQVEYTVLTPSGVLADESYKSPSEIPRLISDRCNQYFETSSLPVVPVYMARQAQGTRHQR